MFCKYKALICNYDCKLSLKKKRVEENLEFQLLEFYIWWYKYKYKLENRFFFEGEIFFFFFDVSQRHSSTRSLATLYYIKLLHLHTINFHFSTKQFFSQFVSAVTIFYEIFKIHFIIYTTRFIRFIHDFALKRVILRNGSIELDNSETNFIYLDAWRPARVIRWPARKCAQNR